MAEPTSMSTSYSWSWYILTDSTHAAIDGWRARHRADFIFKNNKNRRLRPQSVNLKDEPIKSFCSQKNLDFLKNLFRRREYRFLLRLLKPVRGKLPSATKIRLQKVTAGSLCRPDYMFSYLIRWPAKPSVSAKFCAHKMPITENRCHFSSRRHITNLDISVGRFPYA